MIRLEDLRLQEKTCMDEMGQRCDLDNTISLYIVTTRNCNATCDFCEYRGDVQDVDIAIFEETIKKIQSKYNINVIHFTGGEPTLRLDTIKKVCHIAKQYDISTSVNTNGLYLNELAGIDGLNNVALSRHGITDEDNFKIFHTKSIATKKDILSFPKQKLHLSCNLIRGYVDSEEKIYEYLEESANMGVFDIGFVGLMKINPFCEENFIAYPNLSKCTFTTSHRNMVGNECVCQCKNYLYRAKNLHFISIYERNVLKNTPYVSYLVYENNKLRVGFGGDFVSLN